MSDIDSLAAVALGDVADLQGIVGQRGAPRPSKYPVNEAMIGLWCDAVGDDNPAYQDPEWAAGSRWGGIIAPATTLNMWTLPGFRRIHAVGEPLDVVTQTLNAAGFTSVAAVQNDHTYHRPLRPGDRLSQIQHLGWISALKCTALGEGYFFDIVSDFVTAEGEEVGRATMRIFKWAPGTGGTAVSSSSAADAVAEDVAPPPTAVAQRVRGADLTPASVLPTWSLPLTATRITALAAATLDYNDVHFEQRAAVRAGAPDIYLNILGSSGLMNRYLTDWAGPEAELKSARVVLRNQNHPGDVVTFSGVVLSVADTGDDTRSLVEIEVRAQNVRGVHQVGVVTLEVDR